MGANASSLRPHDAGFVEDERVLLEIVKQKGEEAGLGLMIGEQGVLEVVYCEENSPFFGLIEPGDILYEVNGVQYSGAEAREAAQHIRNTTGLALLGTFRKPPPPPVRLPSEPEAGMTQSASTTSKVLFSRWAPVCKEPVRRRLKLLYNATDVEGQG